MATSGMSLPRVFRIVKEGEAKNQESVKKKISREELFIDRVMSGGLLVFGNSIRVCSELQLVSRLHPPHFRRSEL
jgi:hypothetical protein